MQDAPAKAPRRGTRPRITLPIFHLPPPSNTRPSPAVSIPMTPVGGMPIHPGNAPLGLMQLYPTKASEFMFKGFEGFKDFTMSTAKSGLSVGEKTAFWLYAKVRKWSRSWFTHIFLFVVVLSYSCLGALLFVAVEGSHEDDQLRDIRDRRYSLVRELRDLLRNPVVAENDDEWESSAVQRMRSFEDHLFESFKHGMTGQENKVWNFWNAVFYCGTIYTTIGYGHLAPSTNTGRAITIVYAIFGIPLFLILLADFGKLFTRGIKFLWAFVRRVYFTGSCRKVRRTVPVQEVMKGVQLVYDFATFRRPSQVPPEEEGQEDVDAQTPLQKQHVVPLDGMEQPSTPAPSVFEVDDEFNLPISIAIIILLAYIFVGASVYFMWENWGFFESFYFVFISMSTIGFGDFVPQHPMYMMASIVYLVFGLALTSMCINVVQEKLSDSFRQASAKIGATIGLRVTDEDGMLTPAPAPEEVLKEKEDETQPKMMKSAST